MKYRAEIDGLRAIAVTAVILFHAGVAGSDGGFVGVDVFFVISGFLITQILIDEMEGGSFSILRFYERRVRRILPALYVVLAASFVAALYFMLPSALVDFTRSAVATLLFISNIWFYHSTDYFATEADREPLLHTWSLGVEEQFYLFFPLLILLIWRFGRPRVAMILGVLTVASLALSEVGWRVDPAANFYLLPSRAWQLAFGSLGALAWTRSGGRIVESRGLAEALSIGGLALVLGSIILMDAGTPSPSLWALLPTGGALIILLFATDRTLVGKLLALRPMVLIGLMSYSAYLWHQPLFAFVRTATTIEFTPVVQLVLCLVTFALAWATLILVERPFRNRSFLRRGQIFSGAAATTAALLLVFGTTLVSGGFRGSYPPHLREIANMDRAGQGRYVRAAYQEKGEHDFVSDGRPRLLLIGDSFSEDFYNMIVETGAFRGYQIALRFIPVRCQIYLGPENVERFIAPENRQLCSTAQASADLVAIAQEADVVIFAESWSDWAAERLPTTLENFHFRPDQKVLVIGRKLFGVVNRAQVSGKSPEQLAAIRVESRARHLSVVDLMRSTLPPATLVDTQSIVCGGDACPMFTPSGDLISFDGSHLTRDGARYVGSLLFADPHLRPFAGDGTAAAGTTDSAPAHPSDTAL